MQRVIEAKAKSISVSEEELQKDYESMVSLKTFVSQRRHCQYGLIFAFK